MTAITRILPADPGPVATLAWAALAALLALIAAGTAPHALASGAAWCGLGPPLASDLATLATPGHCPACYGTILAGLAAVTEAILWAGRRTARRVAA